MRYNNLNIIIIFSLTAILLQDPFSASHLAAMCQSNTNQSSRRNSLEGLQYFLLGVVDATCIPIFMVSKTQKYRKQFYRMHKLIGYTDTFLADNSKGAQYYFLKL